MRRSYRSERYLAIIEEVRAAMPDAAITTDIIVGFPGETEADFQGTLDVVAAARFSGAFTFQYSIRAGTPAATMPDQVPKAVVQERYERLVELVERDRLAGEPEAGRDDRSRCMFADGEGRKDAATARHVRSGPGQPPGARRRRPTTRAAATAARRHRPRR